MPPVTQTRLIHVILNEASGFDEKSGAESALRRILTANGFQCDIRRVDRKTDLCGLARKMVAENAEIIVAAGGDGTVNAVASALAGTQVALGVLPVGTLNHFARDLEIPLDPEQAMRVIAEGHTVAVDVGEVNGGRFVNNAIIGLYPNYRFLRERHERQGRWRGLAILAAAFAVFRRNPALKLRIEADGEVQECKTPFLMVANNRHEMEGYRLGNRERLDTGQLCVYAMHRLSRWGLARLAFDIAFGRFSKRRGFNVFDARTVTVEISRKTVGVSLDGEVSRMTPPLRYRSLPRSLRVIVPGTYAAKH